MTNWKYAVRVKGKTVAYTTTLTEARAEAAQVNGRVITLMQPKVAFDRKALDTIAPPLAPLYQNPRKRSRFADSSIDPKFERVFTPIDETAPRQIDIFGELAPLPKPKSYIKVVDVDRPDLHPDRKGRYPVIAKPDGSMARIYFDERSHIAPKIISILVPYTQSKDDRGAYGYWRVRLEGLRDVESALHKLTHVRLDSSSWKIAKQIQTNVQAGKRAGKKKLVHARPFKIGIDKDGNVDPYQEKGVRFLMERSYALLSDDMGLGKTMQAIIAAHNIVPKNKQILVVVPASVRDNWVKNEIPATLGPSVKAIALKTGLDKTAIPPSTRFVVVGYESAYGQFPDAILNVKWGCLIIDEAQKVKKVSTIAHKFIERLHSDRTWLLTGTPFPNDLEDIYGLLRLGRHRFSSMSLDQFRKRYGTKAVIAAGNLVEGPTEELAKEISDFVLRRVKEITLKDELPKKYRQVITIDVPGFKARADSAIGDQQRSRLKLALAKVPFTWDIAKSILDSVPNSRVVIFSNFTEPVNKLAALADRYGVITLTGLTPHDARYVAQQLFQGKKLDREETQIALKTFGGSDSRKFRVFIGNLQAAGAGINLTAAKTAIFNDLAYEPYLHQQAEDRIYRIGQTEDVNEIYVISTSPLDQRIWEILQGKINRIGDVEKNYRDPDVALREAREKIFKSLTGFALRNPASVSPGFRGRFG